MSENLSLLCFNLGKQIGFSFKLAFTEFMHHGHASLSASFSAVIQNHAVHAVHLGPDLMWLTRCTKQRLLHCKKMHTLWLCFDMKQTANPAIDRGMRAWEFVSDSLTVPVCLCLYMWPIVACSNELWYEVLCSINLLIQRPLCTTKLNPVQ